jgi:hypothetical protein
VLNAQVELYAAQLGAGALVETDAQGTFSVSSPIPVGIYQAGVGLIPSFPGEAPDPNKKLSPDLPKKFRNLETSGLTVTVAETQNNLLLDLVD